MDKFMKALDFDSDTLGNVKRDMNFVLQRLIGNMMEKGSIPSGSSWPQMVMIHQKSKSHAKQTAARVPQAS